MSRLVCWYSCGAASAVATKMTINDKELCSQYDEVVIAYCKVQEEHEDNDRFLKECEQWFGMPIQILIHEGYNGSIYNVFENNYMRTPAGSPCTRALKKQVRGKFQRDDDTHVFGYTLEEHKRSITFEKNNPLIDCEWVLIDKKNY